jgi:16S rRNA (uracil1498-N3)-methyltransferase
VGAPRFFRPVALSREVAGETVELDANAAHHATRVLRLAVGDAMTLFDGTGGEYDATLIRADKRGATVRIERFVPVERESPLDMTLAQAIAASDAMDSALRKATELGVAAVQPLVTARSAPMPDGERGEKRIAHWRQVVTAAAEQCGRNRIPDVAAPRAFAEWIAEWPGAGIVFVPEASQGVGFIAPPTGPLAILVGPEGGLDARERAAAMTRGFTAARLGPRVLRVDTAVAAAIAVAQASWGDFQ